MTDALTDGGPALDADGWGEPAGIPLNRVSQKPKTRAYMKRMIQQRTLLKTTGAVL